MFVFGVVKVSNNIAQLVICQNCALFSGGVSQFNVGHSVIWLPLLKYASCVWFPPVALCANLRYVNASAICHLGGVPSVVKWVAFAYIANCSKGSGTYASFRAIAAQFYGATLRYGTTPFSKALAPHE